MIEFKNKKCVYWGIFTTFLPSIFFLSHCVGSQGDFKIRNIDDLAIFDGLVYEEKYFGPPNYGENSQTDHQEIAYIFSLKEPFLFITSGKDKILIREVQIINGGPALVGKQMRLQGHLEEAISGHHRRQVIFVRG